MSKRTKRLNPCYANIHNHGTESIELDFTVDISSLTSTEPQPVYKHRCSEYKNRSSIIIRVFEYLVQIHIHND